MPVVMESTPLTCAEAYFRQSVPVTGLVFCTVIFRVGLLRRHGSEHGNASGAPLRGLPLTRISLAPPRATAGTDVTTVSVSKMCGPDSISPRAFTPPGGLGLGPNAKADMELEEGPGEFLGDVEMA